MANLTLLSYCGVVGDDRPTRDGVDGKVVDHHRAGQGIGRGMALHLGKHGARVVVAEWKAHRVERVVDELTELGVDALGVECNILERPLDRRRGRDDRRAVRAASTR